IDDRGPSARLLARLRGEVGDLCAAVGIHPRGEHLSLLGEIPGDLLAQSFLPESFNRVNGGKGCRRYYDQKRSEQQCEHAQPAAPLLRRASHMRLGFSGHWWSGPKTATLSVRHRGLSPIR